MKKQYFIVKKILSGSGYGSLVFAKSKFYRSEVIITFTKINELWAAKRKPRTIRIL